MTVLHSIRIARRRVGVTLAVLLASALGACRTDIRGPEGRILVDTRGHRGYLRFYARYGDGDDDDDDD